VTDADRVAWIRQEGPVDSVLKLIALLAVQRLGGDVTFRADEQDTLIDAYGEDAALHVVGDGQQMRVVVTTRSQIAQNPLMEEQRPN
jgi:hypothetical protein